MLLSAVLLLMTLTVAIIFVRGKIILLAMVFVIVIILLIILLFVLAVVLLKMWRWVKLRQNILCQSKFECTTTSSSAEPNNPDVEHCEDSWPDCALIARQSSSVLFLNVPVNVAEINKIALTCVSNVSKFKRTNFTAEREQNYPFNGGRASSCTAFIRTRPKAKYSSCVI